MIIFHMEFSIVDLFLKILSRARLYGIHRIFAKVRSHRGCKLTEKTPTLTLVEALGLGSCLYLFDVFYLGVFTHFCKTQNSKSVCLGMPHLISSLGNGSRRPVLI